MDKFNTIEFYEYLKSHSSESQANMFEDEEEKEVAEVMEVDQLIQEELGGWMEVQPHTEKKLEPKVCTMYIVCVANGFAAALIIVDDMSYKHTKCRNKIAPHMTISVNCIFIQ